MTDVGFDGTKVERLLRTALAVTRSENIGDRCHLDTVTSLSASSVHLNIADVVSIHTSISKDFVVEILLSTGVRVSDGGVDGRMQKQ